MIIGLTGGIASGKTTVSNILQELGAEIVDADRVAHQILKKGNRGWQQVIDYFGSDIVDEKGEIDRSQLATRIFNNQKDREKLEEITHPLIIEKIKNRITKLQNKKNDNKKKMIVLVAPLLYETGLEDLVDQVWVVYVNREVQKKRLQNRDKISAEEADNRINSQLSLNKKKQMADIVIGNNGTREELRTRVEEVWERVKKKKQ